MEPQHDSSNPLLVASKATDSSVNVQLHPLVLLTISDYITRHTVRRQDGTIAGAIIGQQLGRNVTMEHAFQCKLAEPHTDNLLDGEWFKERLEMYKEVHKVPALELVAIFTLGPTTGPQPGHLPVFKQIQTITSSENVMLLLFHPDQVDHLQGGKLPISLYEPVEAGEAEQPSLRFREVSFEVETGDAERIAVDFVAKGGSSATAVPKPEADAPAASRPAGKKNKGKAKAEESEADEAATVLSPEDDELLSSLTAKANAIRMLHERVQLIQAYIASLPPSYLTDASDRATPPPDTTNFVLLRSISAMLSRLPLLAPPDPSEPAPSSQASQAPDPTPTRLEQAADTEKQDVYLTTLLAGLTRSIAEVHALGSKFSVLQREKSKEERFAYPRGGGGGGLAGRPLRTGGSNDGIMADGNGA